MTTTPLHRLLSYITLSAATLLGACADRAPAGPDRVTAFPASINASQTPNLDACPQLDADENMKLAYHVYARGVQIYRWTGTAWALKGPDAVLSADRGGHSVVGTHYEGPKWESNSGSVVSASVKARCTVDPNAVQWLSLTATSEGPGVFGNVVFIQRVNTAGGKEPATPGASVGVEVRVPYTTEYYFYRAK